MTRVDRPVPEHVTHAPRVQIRWVYHPPRPDDGRRALVDRLWPRGLGEERAHLASVQADHAIDRTTSSPAAIGVRKALGSLATDKNNNRLLRETLRVFLETGGSYVVAAERSTSTATPCSTACARPASCSRSP